MHYQDSKQFQVNTEQINKIFSKNVKKFIPNIGFQQDFNIFCK